MNSILLFIENHYLIVVLAELIITIVLLIKAIKKDNKKNWVAFFTIDVLFTILSNIMFTYSYNKNYSGFEGIGVGLIIVFGAFINCVALLIAYCIVIIRFENNNKKLNKNRMNPLVLIIGISCILVGIFYSYQEICNNWGYRGTTNGIVTEVLGGNSGHFTYVKINIKGEEHECGYINMDLTMHKGDTVKVSYYYYESEYHIHDYYHYKQYYIPAFLVGLLMIAYRFKNKFTNCEINK